MSEQIGTPEEVRRTERERWSRNWNPERKRAARKIDSCLWGTPRNSRESGRRRIEQQGEKQQERSDSISESRLRVRKKGCEEHQEDDDEQFESDRRSPTKNDRFENR
jgi:hypothetical protein